MRLLVVLFVINIGIVRVLSFQSCGCSTELQKQLVYGASFKRISPNQLHLLPCQQQQRRRHRHMQCRTSVKLQVDNTNNSESDKAHIIYPDYLITDSNELSERPSLFSALLNPRDILASTVVFVGTIVSIFNILGVYDENYLTLEAWAIGLGILSSFAHLIQINTGYFISPNIRRGIVDDAAVNLYAALYTGAASWLALRTSSICPNVLKMDLIDKVFASLSIIVFLYSLLGPVITLIGNPGTDDSIAYKVSQAIVQSARSTDEIEKQMSSESDVELNLPILTPTEVMRARGLLFIGILGCVFTPDALSFILGGQDWWGRVSVVHPSQQTLESSTSLFAIFATESSMIAHRVGKQGAVNYSLLVPAFGGVCLLLAVVPCICALYWLGNDISFFSFYRE